MAETTRIAILGASGYTGGELIRILARHPAAEIVLLTAERKAGQYLDTVFPHLAGLGLPGLIALEDVEWHGLEADIVFCALPHGTTHGVVKGLMHATDHSLVDELIHEEESDLISGLGKPVKIIDLSADFRLEDVETYARWYAHEHRAPHLQKEAVYGLTEWAREAVGTARLVANPGCYTTTSLLPLMPLMADKLIRPDSIVIDAKSGVSGAGRNAKEGLMYGEVAEGMHAYGIGDHRHGPEIDQELSRVAGEAVTVSFTPHLVPVNRGILATIYVHLKPNLSAADLRESLFERYGSEPFVTVLPEGQAPATRHVRGSNHCHIGVFEDRVPGRAILVSATDNLVKGAAGQAVQNMNVMLGLEETTGLAQAPLFP